MTRLLNIAYLAESDFITHMHIGILKFNNTIEIGCRLFVYSLHLGLLYFIWLDVRRLTHAHFSLLLLLLFLVLFTPELINNILQLQSGGTSVRIQLQQIFNNKHEFLTV